MAPVPLDDEHERPFAAEALLAAIADASPDVILTVDATGIITSWNPAAEQLYGYTPDEAVGQPVSMLAFADRNDEIDRLLARALGGESVRDLSTVRRRRDGSPVEVLLNVAPLRDGSGNPIGKCVVARDVGPQRAAAAALRRATRSLELAQKEAHLGNFQVNLATGDSELSTELWRLLGGHPAEGPLTVEQALELIHPDDRERAQVQVAQHIAVPGIARGECRTDPTRGPVRWLRYVTRTVTDERGDPIILSGTVQDITEERAAREHLERIGLELAQSHDRLAGLLASMDEIVYSMSLDGSELRFLSPAAEAMYGRPIEDFLREPTLALEVVHPGDRARVSSALTALFAGATFDEVYRIERPDRTVRWLHGHARIVRNDAGTPLRIDGIARDITDQRETETARLTAETMAQAIVESAVDGIIVISARGTIERFNAAAERLFGYAEAEVVGQNVRVLMPSPYREAHDGYLSNYESTGVRRIIGIGRDVEGRRKDGTVFPLFLSVSEMHLPGERKFTGIIHDLTALRTAERRLEDQAALATLGQLAAVVAHEVRNPIAGLSAALQLLQRRRPEGDDEHVIIGEMLQRLQGLSQLVNDLLVYATPRPLQLARQRLRPILESAAAALVESDPQRLHVTLPAGDVELVVDADDLQRAFLNLMANAVHAMKGVGELVIRLDSSETHVTVCVEDTGPGIPPDVEKRLFEPFFTTKARGSGLGLAITKRAVERLGGSIRVDTGLGQGTRVFVDLPALAGV